jgi:hypothetical protein
MISEANIPDFVGVLSRFVLIGFCAGVCLRRVVLGCVIRPSWLCKVESIVLLLSIVTAGAGIFYPSVASFFAILLTMTMFFVDRSVAMWKKTHRVNPVWSSTKFREVQSDH